MAHLTAEQIEQLIQTGQHPPEHLSSCVACRRRLENALAVRARLRSAYESVHADAALTRQVAAAIRPSGAARATGRVRSLLWRFTPGLAAAAAAVLLAVGITLYVTGPQPVQAAQAELAQIHQANLMPHAVMHGSSDPAKVAEYFKKELGFEPALPRLGVGKELRGCCVAHFRNRPVGSYVMDTDQGVVSIIVLRDKPDSLEFPRRVQLDGRTYYAGAFARNTMAAVAVDGLTYCAVGETDNQWLMELLRSLLPK